MKKTTFLLAVYCIISSTIQAQNWSLTGNSGTNPPGNFLGTIDNTPLVLTTFKTERMRITSGSLGFVGIGTTKPKQRVDVKGNINIDSSYALYMANRRVLFVDSIKSNTFLGHSAGIKTTTGNFNTANGYHAFSSNTTGSDNTATGAFTLL